LECGDGIWLGFGDRIPVGAEEALAEGVEARRQLTLTACVLLEHPRELENQVFAEC
jgi:hypothetical protein